MSDSRSYITSLLHDFVLLRPISHNSNIYTLYVTAKNVLCKVTATFDQPVSRPGWSASGRFCWNSCGCVTLTRIAWIIQYLQRGGIKMSEIQYLHALFSCLGYTGSPLKRSVYSGWSYNFTAQFNVANKHLYLQDTYVFMLYSVTDWFVPYFSKIEEGNYSLNISLNKQQIRSLFHVSHKYSRRLFLNHLVCPYNDC